MVPSLPKEKADFAKRVHEVPHKPGVYLMRDRFNRVIYVGKARDLRKRVGSYFMPSKMAQADLKTRALLDAVWDFEFHTVASEPESLLLEGKLIKEFRPRYNISFRDDKRFLLVKVDPKEDWPRFRLARFKKDDGARYFGPYAHAGALRQTLNFMRKKFGVLTFGRGSPTERELKSSTYQVPFRLSEINGEQYRERILQGCDFLEGQSRELIGALEDEMRKAAEKLDFEKAAELRNMLEDVKRTTKPMRRFTRHSLPSTIDPATDVQSLADALGLHRPVEVMECFDISNISTTHVVASMVCFRHGVPDKDNYRRYRIRTVEGQNDFASMAEVVRRRYSRVLLEARDAHADAAEFSQENPAEALERLQQTPADPETKRAGRFYRLKPREEAIFEKRGARGENGGSEGVISELGTHLTGDASRGDDAAGRGDADIPRNDAVAGRADATISRGDAATTRNDATIPTSDATISRGDGTRTDGHPERSASAVEGPRGETSDMAAENPPSRGHGIPPLHSASLHSGRDDEQVGRVTTYVRLPDLIIVDGGKGQLSSACKELQRLGLHELPIIGLAKEYEEIYRPGRALPLTLPVDSGALRLLQRIRDEAHRFANGYHQLLMKKRIGESILDDCPGVSQNRKNLLLRKFGSVSRLRKASVEQIASTEGIGPKLAEDVHRFLQRH